MIKVLFFGKFSEMLGNPAGLSLDAEEIDSVDDIVSHIAEINPELHREITAPQVLVAVNQQVVTLNFPVTDGVEVAFLPPVTGG